MDDSVGLSLMEVKNVESPGVSDPFREAIVPVKERSIDLQEFVDAERFEPNQAG